MKIAYYASLGNTKFQGVAQKIAAQVNIWNGIPSVEAKLFCRTINTNWDLQGNTYALRTMPTLDYSAKLLQDMRDFAPDIVYVREELCGPMLAAILRAFPQKIVLEVNSDTEKELELEGKKSFKRKLAWYYASITRNYLKKRIYACVCISPNFLSAFSKINHKIVIPNSIELDKFRILKNANTTSSRLALVLVGTPGQAWHGEDLLIPLVKAMPECDFHIVGPEQLADAPPNMIFHGYQTGENIKKLYATSHIGIGSLARYRHGSPEASTLKVREYIAHGLPVILGYTDTAFKKNSPPWVLQLTGEEGMFTKNENINKVREFITQYANITVTHQESAPYIDAKMWEGEKIEWLKNIL